MIYKVLQTLTCNLNEYLKRCFSLTEDIAFLSPVKEVNNAFPSNRISVSMVCIEREFGGGISFWQQQVSHTQSRKTAPIWQINVYVLFSAIFHEKQYEESLQVLSRVLSFIQKNNLISSQDSSMVSFAIEPVNLSFHEQSNLWGILGGVYQPSILCKVRTLAVDEQEIMDLSAVVGKPETQTKNKNEE